MYFFIQSVSIENKKIVDSRCCRLVSKKRKPFLCFLLELPKTVPPLLRKKKWLPNLGALPQKKDPNNVV